MRVWLPTTFMIASIYVFGAQVVVAEDDNPVSKLQQEVEKLRSENEKLVKENNDLKEQIANLKARNPNLTKRTLSDLLVPDSSVSGDYRFLDGNKEKGDWTLIINERKGAKFKGQYGDKEAEGTIIGNKIHFKTINTAEAYTVSGIMKGDTITLDYIGARGRRAVLVAKAPEE